MENLAVASERLKSFDLKEIKIVIRYGFIFVILLYIILTIYNVLYKFCLVRCYLTFPRHSILPKYF